MALTCIDMFLVCLLGTGFFCPGQICKSVRELVFVLVKLSRTGGTDFVPGVWGTIPLSLYK